MQKKTTEVAEQEPHPLRFALLNRLAAKYSVDPNKIVGTLKQTVFRVPGKEISDAQMVALLIVADQYNLNPWTREIYAFPDKHGGIVPVVGVDGWSRIINTHTDFDGMEFTVADETTTMDNAKDCPEWIECVMYRKSQTHAVVVREYLDECYRDRMGTPPKDGPWQSHTKRMLRHKAMIQCARIAFGFVGIFDPDEAERIVEGNLYENEPQSTKPRTTRPMRVVEQVDEETGEIEALDEAPTIAAEDCEMIREALAQQGRSFEAVTLRFGFEAVADVTVDRLDDVIAFILSDEPT